MRCRFCKLAECSPRYYVDGTRYVIVEETRRGGPMLITPGHGSPPSIRTRLHCYKALNAICSRVFDGGIWTIQSRLVNGHLVLCGRLGRRVALYNKVENSCEESSMALTCS